MAKETPIMNVIEISPFLCELYKIKYQLENLIIKLENLSKE